MDLSVLWDGGGAALVLGGTLLATALGSGRREVLASFRVIGGLFHKGFDYHAARAEIASDIELMRHEGVLRGNPCHSTDSEIVRITDALVHDRSLRSLIAEHERCRRERAESREAGLRPIRLAAEMAPVFGMAGTLFSLTQMQIGASGNATLIASMAMAILTTLYGILLANLCFSPLARVISRKSDSEEEERQRLIDWMTSQLAGSCPPGGNGTQLERVA